MDITTNRSALAPEITGLHMQTSKFKTKRISLTFLLPLNLHGTATASLLARLLTRSTKKYNTPVALHRKLLSLYGARFSAQVIKLADYQLLNVSITVIEDQFSLHHEALAKEAAALLCDAVFEPNIKDNSFEVDDVEVCRRLLIESIESTINDKRKYAISQMYSAMCQNEPFGIEIGGNIEIARQITGQEAASYWNQMLRQAPVVITVIGSGSPTEIYNEVLARFQKVNRSPLPLQPAFHFHKPQEVQTVSEAMQLTQGKLVMGFRSDISTFNENNLALRIMCDIFGGAPYSKLFTVVREKMSLCYYCAARLQSQKGFICVDSGVENQNIEAAKEGILEQLSAMQTGEFDQQVIEASKMSMADGARSVTDSQEAHESWYLARLLDKQLYSPDEFIAQLADITKENIVKAAQSISLDTVYTLRAKEGA